VVAAVIEATLAELARAGFALLRLEDVAERAGVAKTTLYRRWPTKALLVVDALRSKAVHEDIPDTGSLRQDLLLMVERTQKKLSTPEGRALARIITTDGADKADVELEALCRELRDELRIKRRRVVEQTKERGLLHRDVDADVLLDAIFGGVVGRLLRFGEKTDRPTCERLIDLVVTGAEHGGGLLKAKGRGAARA
jgi:AcrR family transcriptional regulator